jgi:hypothetical protein
MSNICYGGVTNMTGGTVNINGVAFHGNFTAARNSNINDDNGIIVGGVRYVRSSAKEDIETEKREYDVPTSKLVIQNFQGDVYVQYDKSVPEGKILFSITKKATSKILLDSIQIKVAQQRKNISSLKPYVLVLLLYFYN